MFNPDSELNSLIRLDDYKQQRSGGYSTAPFSSKYWAEVRNMGFLRSIGLRWGTLPPASPRRGTKRKTSLQSFFASTHGLRLPSFRPILLENLYLSLYRQYNNIKEQMLE